MLLVGVGIVISHKCVSLSTFQDPPEDKTAVLIPPTRRLRGAGHHQVDMHAHTNSHAHTCTHTHTHTHIQTHCCWSRPRTWRHPTVVVGGRIQQQREPLQLSPARQGCVAGVVQFQGWPCGGGGGGSPADTGTDTSTGWGRETEREERGGRERGARRQAGQQRRWSRRRGCQLLDMKTFLDEDAENDHVGGCKPTGG